MTIWVDAQISPVISLWLNETFDALNAISFRALGLRDATDIDVFNKARKENVIIMSKDEDFVKLIRLHGSPPKLIWLTCGNTSNSVLYQILSKNLSQALSLLSNGEMIVEIS